VCQDTGLLVIFAEIGQYSAHTGGALREAIDQGVRDGWREGFPERRRRADRSCAANTGDNTPAVVHVDLVPGDALRCACAPRAAAART